MIILKRNFKHTTSGTHGAEVRSPLLLVEGHHFIEEALDHEQILAAALLQNRPSLQHDDSVVVQDVTQLMSNSNNRRPLQLLSNNRLDDLVSSLVDVGSGLVHDDDSAFLNEDAGNTDKLPLAKAQFYLLEFQ